MVVGVGARSGHGGWKGGGDPIAGLAGGEERDGFTMVVLTLTSTLFFWWGFMAESGRLWAGVYPRCVSETM